MLYKKGPLIMRIHHGYRALALTISAVAVLVVVGGILINRITRRPEIFERLAQADRVIVYEQDKPELRIAYTGVELSQIIEAIQNSRRDNKAYDTIVDIVMDFYKGEDKIATVYTRSDFIMAGGRKYRARNRTLSRLVDKPLYPAAYPIPHKQNEKGP